MIVIIIGTHFTSLIFLLSKDKEDGVYTRNFAKPTLEDHFDKTVIPKVMQVRENKNTSLFMSVYFHMYKSFMLCAQLAAMLNTPRHLQ